jgi:lipopolysaccharide transport system permease protein
LDLFISLIFLFVLMAWYRLAPNIAIVLLPFLIVLTMLTASGLSLWLGAMALQYRDVRYAVPFAVQFLMYAAPVVYPTSLIPDPYRHVYALNPLVGVIEGFRAALLGRVPVPWDLIAMSTVGSIVILVAGAAYFVRKEAVFADVA